MTQVANNDTLEDGETQLWTSVKTKQRRIYHKEISLTWLLLERRCPSSAALIMIPEKKRDFELFVLGSEPSEHY